MNGRARWIHFAALVGCGVISGWLAKGLLVQHWANSDTNRALRECDFAIKKARDGLRPGERIVPVADALDFKGAIKFQKLGLQFSQDVVVESIANSFKDRKNTLNRFDNICVIGGSEKGTYVISFTEVRSHKFITISYFDDFYSKTEEFTMDDGARNDH